MPPSYQFVKHSSDPLGAFLLHLPLPGAVTRVEEGETVAAHGAEGDKVVVVAVPGPGREAELSLLAKVAEDDPALGRGEGGPDGDGEAALAAGGLVRHPTGELRVREEGVAADLALDLVCFGGGELVPAPAGEHG